MSAFKILLILSSVVSTAFYPCACRARSVDERVFIVPAGAVDKSMLENIRQRLPGDFPVKVKAAIDPQMELPQTAYDASRRQYNAQVVIDELSRKLRLTLVMERALVVTDADLFVPELNFVFGLAEEKKGICVISLVRLRNEFYGLKPDRRLFIDRAVKEAVHELGHSYGLQHCLKQRCAMFFSNDLADTDRKTEVFCVDCQRSLRKRYGSGLVGGALPKK